MPTIDAFTKRLQAYLSESQVQQVRRAYYYAEQAHDGQMRKSGEPYVSHPLAVANILSTMHMDHQSLMAAMLHDVLEDTEVGKAAMQEQFGQTVTNLVDGVSKLTHLEFKTRAESQAHNFQKMAIAMAKDIRVIIIKLADRLHNMRTIGAMRPDSRRRIARETTDIYAPIAGRLGMHDLKVELEDLAFAAYHPMRHKYIARAVEAARGERKVLMEQVKESLQHCIEQVQLQGEISGRQKHLASIYNKMHEKNKPFREIMDVFAFRIVTDKVDTCYRILGAVHHLNMYRPVPGRFKDYIAIPKSNGYQSLHTTLYRIGSGMHTPIEIQIRTKDMDDIANHGIAEHWFYKNNNSRAQGAHNRAQQWIKELLEMQKRSGNAMEFINHVKHDLFPDEVYVFTPKGTVLALPAGATPVDFAYAVHTDVGNSCISCKVNRRLAPLSHPLESGDTVEIVTTQSAKPNVHWLSFVATAKASSNIRHALKNQAADDAIKLGRRLLTQELSSVKLHMDDVDPRRLNSYLKHNKLKDMDHLLANIGQGRQLAYLVVHALNTEQSSSDEHEPNMGPMQIHGTEGLMVKYSKCCRPIPGDSIIGHVNAGHGIVIHRTFCNNIKDIGKDKTKLLPLVWADTGDLEFDVSLDIEVTASRGIIATIAASVSQEDANIEKIDVHEKDVRLSEVHLNLSVHNRVHLAQIIKTVRTLPGVIRLNRR
ncbi:MAG: bifunctional (p)ppGpp synthetase/guanosine-3',5'-bis(diphosphate) 3'-pyrophosphohydrolase [Gammaproteobacteria bacterium]|nr:bifunctional (p)ppGpp synthetase/guanosine-3',5'-bis(diphosphate) 3'-pyrophosphohydrolase [Gammaproteobacteria bacterium]